MAAKRLESNYCDKCEHKINNTCREICPKVYKDLEKITCENIATVRTKDGKRTKFKFIDYEHELFGKNTIDYKEIMGIEEYAKGTD
jgi:hypothetical protein